MEKNLVILINRLVKSGLSEQEIADLAGVHLSTINRLRNGYIKNPSFELALKLNEIEGKRK